MKIDMLMPAAGSPWTTLAGEQLGRYRQAFARTGLALTARPWTEGQGDGDAALALLVWGYHCDVAAWEAMLACWPAHRPLFNTPALLRWNARKTYLAELEAAGVAVVPTWFGRADAESVAAAFERFGCDELVVKPQVSAGSDRTVRVRRGDLIGSLEDAMIQPFLPAVSGEGELSLFYIGGALSHSIRKVAAANDFRVQPQFGGANSRWDADAGALALGEAALAACPEAPLYARIDMIRMSDGRLALMELEAIEPDLYLEHGDGAAERLAEAVIGALACPERRSGTS